MASVLDVTIIMENDGWALYEPTTSLFIKRGLSEAELVDHYGKMFEKAARAGAKEAIKNAKSQIKNGGN